VIPKLPPKPDCDAVYEYTDNGAGSGNHMLGPCLKDSSLNAWYVDLERWHDQIFQNSVEVFSFVSKGSEREACYSPKRSRHDTYKALLMNIQPIVEDTAEQLLFEMLTVGNGLMRPAIQDRAEAFLRKKGMIK